MLLSGIEMTGQERGPEPTGENCSRIPLTSGGPATHAAPPCDLCVFLGQPASPPTLSHQASTQLRVALVGSDEGVHDFVWKAFEAHANGWTLDSHATLHSGLRAPGCALPPPHSSQSKTPASRDIAHSRTLPDVVLLEAQLPGLSGIVCARRLTARLPNARIVMFTACSDHDMIVEWVMAGALGYLIKPIAPENLVRAVSEAAQGRRVLCGEAQAAVMDYLRRIGVADRCQTLTWREREIMLRAMNGAPNKDLATELGIGEGTLHKHLDNIYKKLGVHGKDDARRKFMGG